MFSAPYLCICIYGMLQLGLLIVMETRRRNSKTGFEKCFLLMLIITMLSFVADIMSSLYIGPNWFFPFAAAGNYIEIILNALLLPIYFSYICSQISDFNQSLRRKLNTIIWILTALCALIVISTAFTGTIFYFDSQHVYHRGPLFFVPMTLFFVMMTIIEVFLICQKQKIEANYFRPLVFFLIWPLIGCALQSIIFGLPFSLLGITFAALILFINIQSRNMDKDYLTGAFNRQTLDNYLQRKIDSSMSDKTFSAILLDIDDFKSINDRFGHFEGDVALINAVNILRLSVGRKDFVARYGGDEFCIVLDKDDKVSIDSTIMQIENNLQNFNQIKNKPYLLKFSMGYARYQRSFGDNVDSLYKIIDQKMYEDKNSHRCANFGNNE